MDKYIKRDDLLSLITTLRNHRLLDKYGGAEAWKMAKTLHAADVEPVVHAHWIPKAKMVRSPYARNYSCSHCGHEPLEAIDRCPKCGAKMDGEVSQDG